MLDWAACEPVDDANLPLVLEELDLDGVDPRRPDPVDPERAAALPVIVIGCGESGILAGIRLAQAGIPFQIVEKNAGPGGTWWENTYAPASTSPIISTVTASKPAITGSTSSPNNRNWQPISPT